MPQVKEWMLNISPEELPAPYDFLAREIGVKEALMIAEAFGGDAVYFKRLDSLFRARRDSAILKEYNGFNDRELASKYGLTRHRIRQVINDELRKRSR